MRRCQWEVGIVHVNQFLGVHGTEETTDAMSVEEWQGDEPSKPEVVGIILQCPRVCLVDRLWVTS